MYVNVNVNVCTGINRKFKVLTQEVTNLKRTIEENPLSRDAFILA